MTKTHSSEYLIRSDAEKETADWLEIEALNFLPVGMGWLEVI